MEVKITTPDGGDAIQLGPVRMRILETAAPRITVSALARSPCRRTPTDRRSTATLVDDEGFYVVSGSATFTVGDATHTASAGTLVMVPPGAPHAFANPGDEVAVLLNTFTPDLYVEYFSDLRDMIVAGRR